MSLHKQREEQASLRKRYKTLISAVALVGVTVLFFHLFNLTRPEALREYLDRVLTQHLNSGYSLESIQLHWNGCLELRGLVIDSPGNARHHSALEIDRVELDLSLTALLGDMAFSSIRVENPRVYLELDDSNTFTLLRVLKETPPREGEQRFPAITIKDLEVHFSPETVLADTEPVRLDLFDLKLLGDRRFRFRGSAFHPLVEELEICGTGDRSDVTGRLELSNIEVADEIRSSLTPKLLEVWEQYQLTGNASATIDFELSGGQIVGWSSKLALRRATLAIPRIKTRLSDISGVLAFVPKSVPGEPSWPVQSARIETMSPLRGQTERGHAKLEGFVELAESGVVDYDAALTLDDQRPQELLNLLELAGLSDLPEVQVDPKTGLVDFDLELTPDAGPGFRLRAFEFRNLEARLLRTGDVLMDLSGKVSTVRDAVVEFEATANIESSPLRLTGTLDQSGESLKMDVDAKIDRVVVTRRLIEAIAKVGVPIYERFNPTGLADVEVRLEDLPSGRRELRVITSIRRGSIRYFQFPLPISHLAGSIEFRGEVISGEKARVSPIAVSFAGIRGRHQSSEIFLEDSRIAFPGGTVKRPDMDLTIKSPALLASDSIYQALPEKSSKVVRSFGIEGRLETIVHVYRPEKGGLLDLEVITKIREPVRMQLQSFPYPLALIAGESTYKLREKSLFFDKFVTDRTSGPRIIFGGSMQPTGDLTQLHVDLDIRPGREQRGLDISDPAFKNALPESAKAILEKIQATGVITGQVGLDYWTDLSPKDEGLHNVDFGGNLELVQGSAQVGVALSDTSAKLAISGRGRSEQKIPLELTIGIEEGAFRFRRFFVDQARGTIVYGREHPRIAPGRQPPVPEINTWARPFDLDAAFFQRLHASQIGSALQIEVREANLYGGDTEGFFFVDTKRDDFMGHFVANGIDLSQGSEDLFPTADEVTGTAYGEVRFNGDRNRKSLFEGAGNFDIINGNLNALPLSQAILTNPLFGPLFARKESRKVKEVSADFDIQGDRFIIPDFDDFILTAPSGSVGGRGWMNFSEQLEFEFRNRGSVYNVPLLSELLDQATTVKVKGTIDDL